MKGAVVPNWYDLICIINSVCYACIALKLYNLTSDIVFLPLLASGLASVIFRIYRYCYNKCDSKLWYCNETGKVLFMIDLLLAVASIMLVFKYIDNNMFCTMTVSSVLSWFLYAISKCTISYVLHIIAHIVLTLSLINVVHKKRKNR
tara:strand:+ start:111 stop:551 length:441 start_codon:yes stop_codon:yes gene_type:complete